jgi:nucleoside-diphosphate-sugar epimerase
MSRGGSTVAVIGAGGLLGRALLPQLGGTCEVMALDRRGDRVRGIHKVDARRLNQLTKALRGCDVVVDLAADASWDAPWERVYRNNILIVRTVLEASLRAGVSRVVHASSNQLMAGYETDDPWAAVVAGRYDGLDPHDLPQLSVEAPPRPRSAYGAGKVFAESACRWYSERHGLATVCLRIGTVLEPDRPRNSRHFATWLSHHDLGGFVDAAITAPSTRKCAVGWAVSSNTWRIWDIADSHARLGYEPHDDAEKWR